MALKGPTGVDRQTALRSPLTSYSPQLSSKNKCWLWGQKVLEYLQAWPAWQALTIYKRKSSQGPTPRIPPLPPSPWPQLSSFSCSPPNLIWQPVTHRPDTPVSHTARAVTDEFWELFDTEAHGGCLLSPFLTLPSPPPHAPGIWPSRDDPCDLWKHQPSIASHFQSTCLCMRWEPGTEQCAWTAWPESSRDVLSARASARMHTPRQLPRFAVSEGKHPHVYPPTAPTMCCQRGQAPACIPPDSSHDVLSARASTRMYTPDSSHDVLSARASTRMYTPRQLPRCAVSEGKHAHVYPPTAPAMCCQRGQARARIPPPTNHANSKALTANSGFTLVF